MNKKIKFLTSTLCGVILASGLTFANVQAAPVQNTVKANISTVSTNSQDNFSAAISKDGHIYWLSQYGATHYEYKIYYASGSSAGVQYGGGGAVNINDAETIGTVVSFNNNSPYTHINSYYYFTLNALDRNNNIVGTTSFTFYYDGTNCKMN
ncbi:hypothetical protein [Clostridium scatologenes]|uniref:Uncharacterized protein n=1 Tax=Clostridium scatologenes TaxID=1548 RepID=A0A0E3K490_CLOSL|nr:hypothetical protein [Clostridium scatologenes]AKA72220.1 hypothetical protein CSCA_5095 [Clostridium scatologenes]